MTTLRPYNAILFAKLQKKLRRLESEIVERKLAAEKIQRQNAELEQRLVESAAELSSANEELINFSSWVAHDLRTPLRAIDGFSNELLANCGPHMDDHSKQDLCRICAAAHHMAQLIDDLLELSRLGGSPLNRRDVDLSAQANGIIEKLRQADPARSIDCVIAPGLCATGDPALLQIALENLLRNAWKFTQKQDQPRIEFGKVDHEGDSHFYVRDNGVGFDMAYKEKIFKPFERLHAVREFTGTGIGLALVHRIVRRHGGRIWADAAENRGATFYFTLT